ncbi:hypothetical protein [Deinococcus pimensis]|uniref:hypothetical protein n=1 Tax=Deinococcus pimensis TaxID=309888 RepID=UPI000481A5B6|nr:hypothetical protein [Deinococcus pimensis]
MNSVVCACGREWRFRAHPRGHIVYLKARAGWAPWKGNPWPSTIEKFRCDCGRNLRLDDLK